MNNNNKKIIIKEEFFQKKYVVLFLAIICTALWGSAFPFIKIGYELFNISGDDLFSKLLFAGLRFTLAGIVVLIYYYFTTKNFPKLKKENFKGLFLLGFIQTTLEYFFIYLGLFYTSGVKSNILNSSSVFIMVILAHFLFEDDKLDKSKIYGCFIGFLGVLLVNLDGLKSSFSLNGDIFIVLGASCFAIGSLIGKFISNKEDSIIITGYQLFLGGFILFIAGLLGGGKLIFTSLSSYMLLLYLILLSSLAFTIWTILLKYNNVGKISIFNFLTPLFGTIFSAIFLHENILEVKNIIALILVCIGIYIVNKWK
ncbi:MAG: DMT family transporter [Terrisporobacter sp.]|uniref:DMT family transporter n=1 Tax=Terrisporobacter sp. TaxID=1965305 RepID=UPI002FC9A619